MIRRRRLLQASTALLAAPAIVARANAQSKFDWQQFKGQHIEVNYQLSPRGDVAKANMKKFEELTGISVGFEQIPEQQQRPKVAMEMATGHPSFDVVNVGMHVQKRLIEKAKWMIDLHPLIADGTLTNPDFDLADFSKPSMEVATGADGKLNVLPLNQDLFILFWNKALFAQKGLKGPPQTLDEMMTMAHQLTDTSKGVYGFVGRGLKNANMVLFDDILLKWDQATVTADGKTLLTDTPAAIEAGKWYQTIMRECAPPGVIGYNWNECQTSFMQGKIGMWMDGVGFAPPLLDPKVSKITDHVGFGVMPAGPKAHNCPVFTDAIGIPAKSKAKEAAYIYCQWATGKQMALNLVNMGGGASPRQSTYKDPTLMANNPFGQEWLSTLLTSLTIARAGLPEIVPVTEFRDVFGIALTNMISGADPATELKKATATFTPILEQSLKT